MDCLKRFGDTIGSNGNFFHQWAKLEWNMIFKIALEEAILTTRYGLLPAMICTFNALLGYDNLILLWTMSTVVAYVIRCKRLAVENALGLLSPIAMVRYVTFMLLISICSWISVMTKSTNKSKDSAEIPYKFLGFHATVTANVALYRLYFTFFGVLSNAAKKFQMKKSIKSKYENVESVDDKVTN